MQNAFITTAVELKRLGQNIQIARKRRHLNVSELAAKAGISRQVLMRIEQGDPTVGISKVFNTLEALGLLNGIALFADPEMDRKQVMEEIRELREGKKNESKVSGKRSSFTKEELNF